MKRTILVTLLLLATAVAVKTTGSAESSSREPAPADRWEYLAVAGPTTTNFSPTGNPNMRKVEEGGFAREAFVLEQHLEKLGAHGWDVSVAGVPTDPVFYFRRRR